MVNVLDCNTIVNEFELQSCYSIHFRTNTLFKRHERPIIISSYDLNSNTILFYKDGFGIK